MNWKLPLIASVSLAALGLASCGGLPARKDTTTIANPTVEDMKRLEAQWGVKPAPAHGASAGAAGIAPSGGGATFGPAPSAPSVPAPAPLQFDAAPTTPPAPAPAAPPAIPPSLR
jgi:hypothetical protein